MTNKFDIIVIGSGPAGAAVTRPCLAAGKKLAVVDYLYGGTCALQGCAPRKAMEAVCSHYWAARDLRGHGLSEAPPVRWIDLQHHKQQFVEAVPENTAGYFRTLGATVLKGKAHFTGPHTLEVDGRDYEAGVIVLATGAHPRRLSFEGSEHLISNQQFFELTELPPRILFAGGGYVAFELAHIAAACGSQVTIVSCDEEPLGTFDPELVETLIRSALRKGIHFRLGQQVKSIQKGSDRYLARITNVRNGETQPVPADLVVHAAGRLPQLKMLNLDAAGIPYTEDGVEVNEQLRSIGHPDVYAPGDSNGSWPFTSVGQYEGGIVAHNILHEFKRSVDYTGIPVILHTYPKLAAVGYNEKQLRGKEISYRVEEGETADWLTEKADNNHFCAYKIFISEEDDRLLGANLLGSRAGEVINLFALAMQSGLTVSHLHDAVLAFPTATEAALAVL